METAKLPRCFLDFRDMLNTNPKGGFPYTPPVNLFYGLGESLKMLEEEGLENVFARHHRLAEGIRRAVDAWGLKLCAQSPDLYSETVSAIFVPEGFDSTKLVVHAADKYGVAFGVGLGEVAGKVFRIGHLGSLTDVMALSGIATRRDGDGRPQLADHAWQRRRGGAGILPRHRRRRAAEGRLTMTVDTAEDLYIPTWDDVLAAHERVRPYIHQHADPDLALHQRARRAPSSSSSARTCRRPAPSRCAAPATPSSASPTRRRRRASPPTPRATTPSRSPTPPAAAASPATW